MSNIKMNITVEPGSSIEDAVKESVELCERIKISGVFFKFNGMECHVRKNSSYHNALDKWNEACKMRRTTIYF